MSEVISTTTGERVGTPHYGSQAGDEFGYSVALNFEGTRLAVGAPGYNSDTGYIYVADYDEDANAWTQVGSNIVGPHTSSRFGHSVDINWSGDRIIVGANVASNVYIYDYASGWNLNHVIDTSITSFGHCVSLANDISTRLCVGAPDVNTIYVYEERDGTWDLDFSNVGTDFENVTPHQYINHLGNPTFVASEYNFSNLTYINVYSTYTQYGYSVNMSAFGEHVIVGAPGSRLTQIDSTNSDWSGSTLLSNSYHLGTAPNIPDDYGNYQSGHSRIFKCPDEGNWTSGVVQLGQLLRGDPDGNPLNFWDPIKNSLPGFGFNTHISYDGSVIMVVSVEQGVRSTSVDHAKSSGRVSYYVYNSLDGVWEHKQSITGGIHSRTGWGSALTYDGVRIGHSALNRSLFSKLYDWNGSTFYDVSLPVSGISGYNVYSTTLLGFDFACVNGKFVAVSAPGYNSYAGSVHVFKNDLTSIYNGNSLFSGFIKADSVFIGSNDNSSSDDSKRLLFGGTVGDNSYECSTVENRRYTTINSSELLIAKLPGNAGQDLKPDRVRVKAPGIIFDCPRGDTTLSESRYTETPVFVMNGYQCTGVGHGDTMDPKAQMDIVGDAHATSKITVSSDRKMNWRAVRGQHANDPTEKGGCYLFYNTRDENVITSGNVYSYDFHYATSERSNGVPHNVTYNSDVKGLSFTGSSTSNVTTNQYVYSVMNGTTTEKISFWVRCNNVGASYEQVLDLGGNILSIKQDAIKLNVNATDYTATSQTIVSDTWYHVFIDITRGSVANYDFTLYLDNVQILTQNVGAPLNNFSNRIIFGGGLDGYIGTPLFSAGETNQDRTELYDYGPPDEVFAVGGGATVAGKLGVGVTNPTEALEVNGIIKNNNPRFYAYNNSSPTSTTTTGVLNKFNLVHVNTGNHYNTSLSRFTAPVDGVYEFKFAALHRYISGTGSSELTFAKNGTLATIRGVGYTFVTATSDHDYNTAEILLELVKGDYIEPYIHTVTSGTDIYYSGGLAHFSGKFLG